MINIEVKGTKELLEKMESKFGKEAMMKKSDEALIEGSDYIKSKLEKNFEAFKDTGATIKETKRSEPHGKGSARRVLIYWDGPKLRQKLIHLNEHGYDRKGRKHIPRGFGVIAKTLENTSSKYKDIVIRKLGE